MNTGRSKKFGFVVYKDKSSADNALSQGSHIVDGKQVFMCIYLLFYCNMLTYCKYVVRSVCYKPMIIICWSKNVLTMVDNGWQW